LAGGIDLGFVGTGAEGVDLIEGCACVGRDRFGIVASGDLMLAVAMGLAIVAFGVDCDGGGRVVASVIIVVFVAG
jgi:hypothetical protein